MLLNKEWSDFLDNEIHSNYFIKLQNFIDYEYKTKNIFPKYENIFRAFNLTSPDKVKVVILGQDPYHGINQANGLAFSVCDECKIPPSLKNIFKELQEDIGCKTPRNGNLGKWAQEGVLLINSVLTVVESKANSHKNIGWETFTDSVINKLSCKCENIVFILWGAPSQKKESLIDLNKHLILKAPHPSPLSSYRGFFGSKPFSQSNRYLNKNNKIEIDWCLN
ncbi:MAG: uracil-DNA glycosylase [Sulfurimonas sp.]|uniref:uracil-DNA glycosylase n=1 Tax=Sulfurimonas sp. TaxID=2022749 RepID=UPI00262ACD70|nr:uracil-DNA glycosylase [Sulfurimonas sp.]MCW8894820.1 uracil-DNA glycosylase [Sulfurimonas sp.]MCW8954823.1 uracil-DNA glycosylase [Sulfurimonas sp.]MCW9067719.1 uracil-DNA glycosylase [Sulfurimonas sp.]